MSNSDIFERASRDNIWDLFRADSNRAVSNDS